MKVMEDTESQLNTYIDRHLSLCDEKQVASHVVMTQWQQNMTTMMKRKREREKRSKLIHLE